MKSKRGLVIADLHCGHISGFTPPGFDYRSEKDTEIYKVRRLIYKWTLREAKKRGPYDFMIVDGDCIDGRGEKSGGTELLVTDRLRQCKMAAEAIMAFNVPKIYMTYGCLTPGHRILTADLRWVPVENLRKGDEIIGFDEEPEGNTRRRFYSTKVIANKPLKKFVYRLNLSDGTTIEASEDHPFLSSRGYSYSWSTVKEMYRWMYFEDGTRKDHNPIKFPRMIPLWEKDTSYASGYLAGFFDGEGSLNQSKKESRNGRPEYIFALHGYQNKNAMLIMALTYLQSLGFEYSVTPKKNNIANKVVKIIGGRWEVMRLLGTIRPMRLLGRFNPNLIGTIKNPCDKDITIETIERLGIQEVCGMSTECGTYVSEGFLSHNTAYHTGQLEDFEDIIADLVGAQKIGGEDNLDVNGCIINYRHHIGRSSIPHGRHTSIAKEHLWNQLWAQRGEYPLANIIIRSHVHYHAYAGGPGWVAMTTPALQNYGGKYGSRIMSGTVDIGFIVLQIDNRSTWAWEASILRMPLHEPLSL